MMRIGLMVMGKVEKEEPGRKLSLGGVREGDWLEGIL